MLPRGILGGWAFHGEGLSGIFRIFGEEGMCVWGMQKFVGWERDDRRDGLFMVVSHRRSFLLLRLYAGL